jgi:hypothetical protein
MANTTFKGPVRAENGFEQISINSTTGAVTTNFDIDTSGNVDAGSGNIASTGALTIRQKVDNTTFNTGSAVTDTLTAAESGTLFTIDGTGDIIVNMPALSTDNPGIIYEFIVTTAVGGGKTVTFVLPGSAVSNWYGALSLMGGTAANPATDVAGDTLTLVNSTVVNSRVKLTCVTDDGTNSTWKAEVLSSPISTIA